MKTVVAILSLIALGACGSSKPAAELYALRPAAPSVSACGKPGSIKIYEPVAGPGLDSPRIAVMAADDKQTFYSGVRWNATATRMVQHYLADAFEQSSMFSTVTTDDSTSRATWLLESQLRAFNIDQSDGQRRVVIRLSATLIDTVSHKPVLSLPLQATANADSASMEQIVELFNEEMAGLTTQLLQAMRPKLPGC